MRQSQILKLITVIGLVWLFIILLMKTFNYNQSYHYKYVERTFLTQQQEKLHDFKINKKNFKVLPTKSTFYNDMDLKVDYNAKEPLFGDVISEIQRNMPSLPIEYFYRHSNKTMQKFKNCAQYPAIQTLNFYNTYWQTLYIDNSIFQLYGAYYDDRPISGPVIRILAMTNHQQNEFPIIYCQLWYEDDNRPMLTTIKDNTIIWETRWGTTSGVYYPYLMTCEVPKNANITGDPIPKVVNLVRHQCDTASNSLRIVYDKPLKSEKKHEFAVCVKGLDFPYQDLSTRLVEWLELLKLLGVHKVYMHRLQVHANISKVLDYYQKKGFVETQNVTLVGGVVGQPDLEHILIKGYPLNRRLNELIPYNDCFYRNMYKYDYITLLDIDEIIMPTKNLKSWSQLVTGAKFYHKENNSSFDLASLCVSNVYFPSKQMPLGTYPPYMYMLNRVYRYYDEPRQHIKCLHNTQHVVTLHNHYPLSYLNKECRPLDLPVSYAQLQHYRDAGEEAKTAYHLERDNNMERFQRPLIEKCTAVLRNLKFLS